MRDNITLVCRSVNQIGGSTVRSSFYSPFEDAHTTHSNTHTHTRMHSQLSAHNTKYRNKTQDTARHDIIGDDTEQCTPIWLNSIQFNSMQSCRQMRHAWPDTLCYACSLFSWLRVSHRPLLSGPHGCKHRQASLVSSSAHFPLLLQDTPFVSIRLTPFTTTTLILDYCTVRLASYIAHDCRICLRKSK